MSDSAWFALWGLFGVNAGIWLAVFLFGGKTRSPLRPAVYYSICLAGFLVLAGLIGGARPAGPRRGDGSLPGAMLLLLGWALSFAIARWVVKTRRDR